MARDVGIVVPAYRPDPDRLGRYLVALDDALAPTALRVELDAASPAVSEQLAQGPATVNAVPYRRGKGTAITAGFEQLETDVLVFTDADGSTSPTALETVIDPVRSGRTDIAVGSRRHPDSQVRVHQSRVRRRLGDLFVRVAHLMLPVTLYDYQCGAKALDRQIWEAIRDEITAPGFAWDIEMLTAATLHGAHITEIPIVWDDQPGSTVPVVRTGVAFARALLRGWHLSRCQDGSLLHRLAGRMVSDREPLIRALDAPDPIGTEEQ